MLSLVGVVTNVTYASVAAVVSVVIISSISSSSLLEEQEIMIVKPIHETNKT